MAFVVRAGEKEGGGQRGWKEEIWEENSAGGVVILLVSWKVHRRRRGYNLWGCEISGNLKDAPGSLALNQTWTGLGADLHPRIQKKVKRCSRKISRKYKRHQIYLTIRKVSEPNHTSNWNRLIGHIYLDNRQGQLKLSLVPGTCFGQHVGRAAAAYNKKVPPQTRATAWNVS